MLNSNKNVINNGSITLSNIQIALKKVGLTKVDKDILSKCVALASAQQISPEQMAECWEAFSLNKNVSELTSHTYEGYRSQLLKDSKVVPTNVDGVVHTRKVKREINPNMVTPPASKRGKTSTTNVSPEKIGSSSKVSPIASVPHYKERKHVGDVVASYTGSGISNSPTKRPEKNGRCVITMDGFPNVTEAYRYMFSTIPERADSLEKYLVNMGRIIIEKYGISDGQNGIAPLGEVNIPSQEKICCVGRICNEAHEGKLNKTSVVLEGSSASSGGARINVDLSQLDNINSSYSLFPGQIVAIEGINLTGRRMVAQRICEGAPHGVNMTTVKELRKFHYDYQDGAPLKIVTACGPFTTSDNIEYEPLIDLMSGFLADPPDVVILLGPFVDSKQEWIKSGRVLADTEDGEQPVVSYETFFENKVAELINECFKESCVFTQFVLIPSVDDAISHGIYPQPPLDSELRLDTTLKNTGGGQARVHFLSNPCTFKINETVFGVTSTDVLFHMSAEGIHCNLPPNSRLRRIAQHILQQRSYYPVFPPPAHSPTNLELKRIDQWSLPCRPDVLLLPSKLNTFAHDVLENTVVINSGPLSRATSGGTYAVIDIHPMKREILDEAADDISFPNTAQERIHVTVKRI